MDDVADFMVYIRKRISSMLGDYSDGASLAVHNFRTDVEREWGFADRSTREHIGCFLAYHGAIGLQSVCANPERLFVAAEELEKWIVANTPARAKAAK